MKQLPIETWAVSEYRKQLAIVRRNFMKSKGPQAAQYAFVVLLCAETSLNRRIGDMTIKKQTGKDFSFAGWVNVRLSEEDKGEIAHKAENINPEQLLDWIASMAYQGYSFSVSWDDWSDAQQVSLVCKATEDKNFGLGLSARHPEFDLAVLTLLYKHDDILRGDWSDAPTPQANGWG